MKKYDNVTDYLAENPELLEPKPYSKMSGIGKFLTILLVVYVCTIVLATILTTIGTSGGISTTPLQDAIFNVGYFLYIVSWIMLGIGLISPYIYAIIKD